MRLVCLVVLGVTLAACDGPLEVGKPLLLGGVNGEPLPYAPPGGTLDPPLEITEGWLTLLHSGLAERHERTERVIVDGNGDSVPLVGEWTYGGPYRRLPGRIIVTYPFWTAGQPGPDAAEDTFYVTERGVVLPKTGFLPPLDSMVRVYCSGTPPC